MTSRDLSVLNKLTLIFYDFVYLKNDIYIEIGHKHCKAMVKIVSHVHKLKNM